MPSESVVRIAVRQDAPEIWRLFLQGHRENGLFTLAPDKVHFFMERALCPELIQDGDTGPRGIIGVIGPVGGLEGLVFVTIGTYWYTHEKHIQEFLVFVDPECRQSDHASALVDWMKQQVEATKLPLLTGVISTKRTEAKCRLYRRLLPKVGEFFYLGPKGSGAVPALIATSS